MVRLVAENDGDFLVVTVEEDRIDAGTAVAFKDSIKPLVDTPHQRVLLDLSSVDSIDSSGLGAVVAVMKHLGPGRSLELSGLSPKVLTVFRLTRMDQVMRLHESRAEALKEMRCAS
jgi:anti-sigma B factor antagonist